MKKNPDIVNHVKGEASFSIKLSNAILKKLLADYPGSQVRTHDLSKTPFPHLEETHFASFYTPEEMRTDEHKEAIKHSDEAIKRINGSRYYCNWCAFIQFRYSINIKSMDRPHCQGRNYIQLFRWLPERIVVNKKFTWLLPQWCLFKRTNEKLDFTEPFLRTSLVLSAWMILRFFGLRELCTEFKETALSKAMTP